MSLPVVFIAGATASGKTGLACSLADRCDVDLINVDAAQVYKHMDIGTAKLSSKEQAAYPHALIDILDPAQTYDAAQFVRDAYALIEKSHAARRIPVFVGGSMFYFSALEHGVSNLPQSDADTRAAIEQEADVVGWAALHAQLQQIDPNSAARIQTADKQRIQRALELFRMTGQTLTELQVANQPEPLPYTLQKFALTAPDRATLHQRIDQRFTHMLNQGLVEEVAALKQRCDLSLDLPSMRCVGYRQTWEHLNGAYDLKELQNRSTAATRQLAKRQLTWLRNQRGMIWLGSESKQLAQVVQQFL